jgi:hypothetical protein
VVRLANGRVEGAGEPGAILPMRAETPEVEVASATLPMPTEWRHPSIDPRVDQPQRKASLADPTKE